MTMRIPDSCDVLPVTDRDDHRSILLQEKEFVVKTIIDEMDRAQAFRLRHRIFCDELKWVLHSTNDMESDEYDRNAVFFGVFDENRRLVSFLRLILPDRRFMMEQEFLFLVDPGHRIRKERDTAEISRLCVAPEARRHRNAGNFDVHKISLILFKGVYQWCMLNKIRYLYAVTEQKVYRLYCLKGFPYRLIGKPARMPDGATVAAVMLDWYEFETTNTVKRHDFFGWFTSTRLSRLPQQSQPHGTCLKHLASA
jgi:N-acyl amino acid synthase of PEP-CTERM/exosortase system